MTYAERMYEEKKKGREEGMAIGEARGEARGRAEGLAESAIGMIRDNMSVKLIMKYTQLSFERIQELAAGIGVAVVM